MKDLKRCDWVTDNLLYQDYHDNEWGVPVHDDQVFFEFLTLEGAQAGLSWLTILKKRAGYRRAFEQYSVEKIARYSGRKVEQLCQNPEIVRNRLKIQSVVTNAQKFMAIQAEFGTFDRYIWRFVDGKVLVNHWNHISEVPVSDIHSEMISKDLKSRGFKFVGTTICYALMQATGLVNDHLTTCCCYDHTLT